MGAIVAGWCAGYFMALLSTAVATYLLIKVDTRPLLARIVDPEVSRPLLVVPYFIGASLAWTALGLVIGSAYRVMDLADGPSGLGAPHLGFALGMCAVGAMPVPILVAVGRRFWWLWASMGATFAAAFGWAMPLLADRW